MLVATVTTSEKPCKTCHITWHTRWNAFFTKFTAFFFSLQLANKQNSFSQETKIKINIQSHKVTLLHGYTTLFEGVFPIYHFEVHFVHVWFCFIFLEGLKFLNFYTQICSCLFFLSLFLRMCPNFLGRLGIISVFQCHSSTGCNQFCNI